MKAFVRVSCAVAVAVVTASSARPSEAAEWFVAAGATGSGTSASPYGRIQSALNMAQPGDTIIVRPGTYAESLTTVRSGTAAAPIRLRAEGARGSVVVSVSGRVLRVDHAYLVVERMVFDGQYGFGDTLDVNSGANYLVLRDAEVRRSTRDLIDIAAPTGVLIENCLIHHALNAANGRTDAHGVVAGAVRDLIIRNSEIHTFSGDAFQVDPGRSNPGWSRVTIEGTRMWLAPLPAAENGFAAGTVPGENAIDTKAASTLPRSSMTIRDVTAWGFRNGLITNMAAFNLKENVNVTLDRVTVYDSEIAFRLRGPTSATDAGAWVTAQNAVVYNVLTGFRYENNIEQLRIWNATVGSGVSRPFQAASSTMTGLDVRNVLFLGTKPKEAVDASNLSVSTTAFVNASVHNYQLAPNSPAVDSGVPLASVATDRAGVARPQGLSFDIGAYEQVVTRAAEIVVHAWRAMIAGNWQIVADVTAAGGARLHNPNNNKPPVAAPLANPLNYAEVTTFVERGTAYRLWLRGRAASYSSLNDSVYVQFSGAVTPAGNPTYRIGTSSATLVNLEDCSRCGLTGWGWQDNGWGSGVLGPTVQFAESGLQTIRIQPREDGMSIDQIVLSPASYLFAAPGALKNDTTILPES